MWKRVFSLLLAIVLVGLTSCAGSIAGSLKRYVDTQDGYEFFYPNGWVPVKVSQVDVAFRDLIEPTENVSVIMSPVPEGKTLTELGTPGEVGYKLQTNAIAPPDSNRKAELVSAESREVNGNTYYTLEYLVSLPGQQRHNLASVVVSRGQLFTVNASTTEARWEKAEPLLRATIASFRAY